MGGCRCIFRDCEVNTSHHPNMHFFKFPVNEEERFQKWIKFSGAEDILKLKPAQQLNRAVCGRHFRDEAFMNYKKDRLCRNQIPTITRISETLAFDYENVNEDGTPKLIKLEKATLPHLIPPIDFVCPLGLPFEEQFTLPSELPPKSSAIPLSSVRKRSLDQEILDSSPISNKKCWKADETELPACNIINTSFLKKPPTIPSIEDIKIVVADDAYFGLGDIDDDMIKGVNSPLTRVVEIVTPEIDARTKKLNDLIETHKTLELNHIKLTKDHKDLLVAHDELQMKCDKLESELKLSERKVATATAPPAAPTQQLTKPQLFHGIKRYLCSSMTTLVRMEMFGSSEREWKPDERLVSMDLMRLGDNVYKFFIDEWRVRIPSLREVHSWLSKAANTRGSHGEEEEEDL